jgi:Na+/glutamate symporter
MLHFVRTAFRGFIAFILWINLIFTIILGGIIGYFIRHFLEGYNLYDVLTGSVNQSGGYSTASIVIGAIIGLILGLFFNIIFGGFIATILNMDKNLEEINNKNGSFKETLKNWNKKYILLQSLDLKKIPDNDSESAISLENGEIVTFLNEAYEESKTKTIWYKVNYKNVEGWCISTTLEKYYE